MNFQSLFTKNSTPKTIEEAVLSLEQQARLATPLSEQEKEAWMSEMSQTISVAANDTYFSSKFADLKAA